MELTSSTLIAHGSNSGDSISSAESARSHCSTTPDPMSMSVDSFDVGYDSDPIDRFFHVSRWQRQLSSIQRRLRRRGASPQKPPRKEALLREIRERRQAVASRFREEQRKVVGTMRERQQRLQQRYTKQVKEMRGQLDKVLSKARLARARQIRHMVCFVLSMADVVATAFWLGASPSTFHHYYTFKCTALITGRAIWYRWHGWHYFLFDLCYFCNAMILTYLWIFPNSEMLFSATYGFSGMLLIAIPLFRNSFVPHSLDRVTSVQIHLAPAFQLWALRWYGSDGRFAMPETMTVIPSLCFYIIWAMGYVLNQFVFDRRFIETKGYPTLFKHMAVDMGMLKILPRRLQGPVASRVTFVLGHFGLFCSCLPAVHFPFFLHCIALCVATLWTFKNGASFYITYFWRVYDAQIHAFEQQMAQAAAESQKETTTVLESMQAENPSHTISDEEYDDADGDTEMDNILS